MYFWPVQLEFVFGSPAFLDLCGRVPLGSRQYEPVLVSRSALPSPAGLGVSSPPLAFPPGLPVGVV